MVKLFCLNFPIWLNCLALRKEHGSLLKAICITVPSTLQNLFSALIVARFATSAYPLPPILISELGEDILVRVFLCKVTVDGHAAANQLGLLRPLVKIIVPKHILTVLVPQYFVHLLHACIAANTRHGPRGLTSSLLLDLSVTTNKGSIHFQISILHLLFFKLVL